MKEKEYYDINEAASIIGVDGEDMAALIEILAASLEEEVPKLKEAVESKDHTLIHKFSHKLKGSSSNMRFHAIAEACKNLDELSKIMGGDLGYAKAWEDTAKAVNEFEKWFSGIKKR